MDVLNDYYIMLIDLAVLSNIVKLSLFNMIKDQVLKKVSDKLWIIDLYADLNGLRFTLRMGILCFKLLLLPEG